MELVSASVERDLPVLGVCLGAQQLALALGADVATGADEEIGIGAVSLTGPGRRDPVFGPEYGGLGDPNVPCVHWHADTFSLPERSVHVAATRMFPNQAFRFGNLAYGLQFHVEVDAALARAWRPHLPDGVSFDSLRLAQVEATGRRILRRFVGLATSSSVPVDGR
jgi:GMP synthase-like glutamine amidotransferase